MHSTRTTLAIAGIFALLTTAGLTPATQAVAASGVISGTISAPNGDVDPDTEVHLFRKSHGNWAMVETWYRIEHSDDTFRFRGLPAGNYTLGFDPVDPDLAPMLLGETMSFSDAEVVRIEPGDSRVVSALFTPGVTIQGSVLFDGEPVERANPTIMTTRGVWGAPRWLWPDANGEYRVSVLPGSYMIRYDDRKNEYIPTWNGAYRPEDAEPLVVDQAPITVNIELERGSHIFGMQRGPSGKLIDPSGGVYRRVDDRWVHFGWVRWVYKNGGNVKRGRWTTAALPTGDYRVYAYGGAGDGTPFSTEFYDGHALAEFADVFTVGTGGALDEIGGVDFALTKKRAKPVGVHVRTAKRVSTGNRIAARLSMDSGAKLPKDIDVLYRWFDGDGNRIPGETTAHFTPGKKYAGERIRVDVVVGRLGWQTDRSHAVTSVRGR